MYAQLHPSDVFVTGCPTRVVSKSQEKDIKRKGNCKIVREGMLQASRGATGIPTSLAAGLVVGVMGSQTGPAPPPPPQLSAAALLTRLAAYEIRE